MQQQQGGDDKRDTSAVSTKDDPYHGFMRKPRCPCANCQKPNCGICINCLGKVKFGGDGRNRRRCTERSCLGAPPRSTAAQRTKEPPAAAAAATTAAPPESPNGKRRVKRRRCGTCPGCLAPECGVCLPCQDHPKFGGEGKSHACCLNRQCRSLFPLVTANGNTRVRDLDDKRMGSNDNNNSNEPTAKRPRRPPTAPLPKQQPARRVRCGKCPPCRRPPCEQCAMCVARQLSGGRASKKVCELKRCRVLYPGEASSSSSEPTNKAARTGSMKHGGGYVAHNNNKTTVVPALPCPVPTVQKYLQAQSKKSEEKEEAGKEKESEQGDQTGGAGLIHYCGLAPPPKPEENSCAACRGDRDDELHGQLIVLCDGPNCNREYHLDCVHPPLFQIPRNDWLCEDCCPMGNTASLIKHLESCDERRATFMSKRREGESFRARQMAYLDHLMYNDSKVANRPTDRVPCSELDRSAVSYSAVKSSQTALARKRGAKEHEDSLSPEFMVGFPIRIYIAADFEYHVGRIVDYRHTGEGEANLKNSEFLIRFAAGPDGLKKPYQHWIMLEEHATVVGTRVIWAQTTTGGTWEPAILWVRSARELVTTQVELRAAEGEIRFRRLDGKIDNTNEDGLPLKNTHRVYALAKMIGTDVYRFINVRTQAAVFDDPATVAAHLHQGQVQIQYNMAMAELAEQERIKRWQKLPCVNPLGPNALSSRDSYTLPALEIQPLVPPMSTLYAAPPPSIPRGLDRFKILKLLQQRHGVDPSKDAAASITSCKVVGIRSKLR